MKRFLYLFPLLILILGCNNRENLLLPPDLSPADYLSGNKLETYSDYLVKSANDDSYLLIHKEAIADSLLSLGDEIIFQKVQNLNARDSLGIQTGAVRQSYSYRFSVSRGGSLIELSGRIPLADIYTDLNSAVGSQQLIYFSYYLQAKAIQPVFYGDDRAHFPLYGTCEFGVYSFPSQAEPQLSYGGADNFYALLLNDSGNQLNVNFPASYTQAAGGIELTMSSGLTPSQQTVLGSVYPNAAVSQPVIGLQTTASTGSETAVLRLLNVRKGKLEKEWTRLSGTAVYGWQETDSEAATANWWENDSTFYGFLQTSGSYCLVSPLSSQTELTIPLDGSFNQVFLQNLWFDLQSLSLSDASLKLSLNPQTNQIIADYFSGAPFTPVSEPESFGISFWQAGSQLSTLPNDAWIEFGFRSNHSADSRDRLFRVFRDGTQDLISYKTPSTAYDSDHYLREGSYVYCGISSSATYLYGAFTESMGKLNVPYKKTIQYVQTAQAIVSWQDSTKRSFGNLILNLKPTLPSHPWLSGEPFTLDYTTVLAQFSFYAGGAAQSTLPAGFYLHLPTQVGQNVLLFNNLSYPRLKYYLFGETYTGDTYVPDASGTGFVPEFPGTLIAADVSYATPVNMRMFSTQTFIFGEFRIYTYGSAPADSSVVVNVSRTNGLPDSFGALATQYELTATSSSYYITTEHEASYQTFEPMLFFKRQTRDVNILFYERSGLSYYRLYPYTESAAYDPWHFYIDNGYNGIPLVYNGYYRSFTDNNPHTSVSMTVDNSRDSVLSLYQAQFVLQLFFYGTTIPDGTNLGLQKLSSLPGVSNLKCAYRLSITNQAGQTLSPNFYGITTADRMPYVYIPLDDPNDITGARVFYRDLLGNTVELQQVDEFGTDYANECVRVGNCYYCTVKNPGLFYITGS